MFIPIRYNLQNLRVRIGVTLLTIFGIAITTITMMLVAGAVSGLKYAFITTGEPLNVIVVSQGLQREYSSTITRESLQVMKFLPGIAKDPNGAPVASGEVVVTVLVPRRDGTGEINVMVRGLNAIGVSLRPRVKLVAGRWFTPGLREVVVGQSVHRRFAADLGQRLWIGRNEWTVVGIFGSGGAAQESEIWADLNQAAGEFNRPKFSSLLLRAENRAAMLSLVKAATTDERLHLSAMPEADYYSSQTQSKATVKFLGTVVVILMGIGSCFMAANTMYTAVAHRTREIAVLRVLGFSRLAIMVCFVLEAVVMALLGGVLGVIVAWPANGLTTGTFNAATFSEIVFTMRLTPLVVSIALTGAAIMGVLGGIVPAWQASRQSITMALRA